MLVRRLCFALALAWPTFLPAADKKAPEPDVAKVAELIVTGTNEFRQHEDQRQLARNARLDETARYFARFMADSQKFGHEADGRRPDERAKQRGYDYCIVLENIAYQFDSTGFKADDLA